VHTPLFPGNPGWIEITEDFMLKYGYIETNLDVAKWAAPEFHGWGAGIGRAKMEEAVRVTDLPAVRRWLGES
jgi:hypothetical protein